MIERFGHPVFDTKSGTCGLGELVTRYVFQFENGFGASVIRGLYTYGGRQGLWELAVLR